MLHDFIFDVSQNACGWLQWLKLSYFEMVELMSVNFAGVRIACFTWESAAQVDAFVNFSIHILCLNLHILGYLKRHELLPLPF